MKTKLDDKGQPVFSLGSGLAQTAIELPATIKLVKDMLEKVGTLKTIECIKKMRLTAGQKKDILFIASGHRLTKEFK